MPIEFRCTQCDRLLRTGEGTAGKQAKCPECGAVMTVPAESAPAADFSARPRPLLPPSEQPTSPFSSAAPKPVAFDPSNPYAAPGQYAAAPGYAAPPGSFAPTIIDFSDVFSRTWAIFKQQWGMCLAVFLVAFAINMGLNIVVGIGFGIMGTIARDPAITILCNVLSNAITGLFGLWIGIGQARFFLKTARGQQGSLSDIFTGGPYFLTVLLASILIGLLSLLIVVLIAGPCALVGLAFSPEAALGLGLLATVLSIIPVIVVSLVFSQYYYLILDRNVGVIDSLRISMDITRGNKLTIFLIGLVAGMVGAVLILCTCGLGMLVVAPFCALLYAMIYLAMTGQRTADQMLPGKPTAL